MKTNLKNKIMLALVFGNMFLCNHVFALVNNANYWSCSDSSVTTWIGFSNKDVSGLQTLTGARASGANLSLNNTSTCIGDSVAIGNVNYFAGGFSYTATVSGNIVTVSNFTTTDNYAGIVGGCAISSNTITGNTVNVNSGTFNSNNSGPAIFGGYNDVGSGDVTYNVVNINEGTFQNGFIIGGGVVKDGSATNNTVNVNKGIFQNATILGGYVKDGSGNAQNNTVNINGGTFKDTIIMGSTTSA
ncbi:MAG: hypothetical protein KBS60_03080, partial [Phascolarctobacterium sp.]|nr:hypothetical protein [Candidatus Phascolarctobacterium caballi]